VEKASGIPPKEMDRNGGNPSRPLRKTDEGGGERLPEQAEHRRGMDNRKMPEWEGRKLHSLMPFVFRRKELVEAWEEVRQNKGAPGVDNVSIEKYEKNVKGNLWELSEALRKGEWRPKPLKRVWIPKPDGTKRGLAVPAVEDRIVHGAVANVLYAVFEDSFGPSCYAYVKGRNAHDAISGIMSETRAGMIWVFETDIEKFFDTIDRERAMDKLAERIADGSFLRLVRAIIKSEVLGETADETAGIPQGSPMSPLLANIYLAEFDRKIGGRYKLYRYADDILALCRTEREAERARKDVEEALKEEGLNLKPRKTKVTRFDIGVEFLGYHLSASGPEPSRKAVERLQQKIRGMTVRHWKFPVEDIIQRMMPVIRGWTNYFKLTRWPSVTYKLGQWILTRVQSYITKHKWASSRRKYGAPEKLYAMGLRLPYHILKEISPGG
jgi:RNA-directed DNA polymerase